MRYRKYFLNHLLWLDDGFCQYYLQNPTWITEEILDVEVVAFNWPEEAEQWLTQCAEHDPETTFRHLRTFLADHCQEDYTLHRMNNRRVLKAAARQISQNLHKIVIEPQLGWAVQVDPLYNDPVVPVSVEPDSEYSHLLEELQTLLNGLVADQQKRHDVWEARMAGMNRIQRTLFIKKQIDDASKEHLKESALDTISFFAKFYPAYLKTLWKVIQAPSRMSMLTAEALATGSMDPLKDEIDKIVTPVARTYEEAQRYKTMLTILLSNRQTHETLWNFAQRYYDATHPIDLARMGSKGVTEVMLNIILALVSAGAVVAINAAAKSVKLVKVAKLLEKIAFALKRLGPESKVVNKLGDLLKSEKKAVKAARKAEKLVPDKKHKPPESLDDGPKKEYGKHKDKDGSKTTAEINAAQRIAKLDTEGHAPIRHGGPNRVTDLQLEDRAVRGVDPASGTTFDAFNKFSDGSPKPHKVGRNATAFASDEALVHADDFVRKSTQFEQNIANARANGDLFVDPVELPLKDVFGPGYKDNVRGVTRLGSKNNPTGHVNTDFTDGTIKAIYRLDQDGNINLHTLYPNPKP